MQQQHRLCILRLFGEAFSDVFLIDITASTQIKYMDAPYGMKTIQRQEFSKHLSLMDTSKDMALKLCKTYVLHCDLFVTENPITGKPLELRAAYDAACKTVIVLLDYNEQSVLDALLDHVWYTGFNPSQEVF